MYTDSGAKTDIDSEAEPDSDVMTRACTHTPEYAHVRMHAHARACTHVHARTRTYTHVHARMYVLRP
eukprot:15439250-Alexandrium_andersonii.AAC.1